MTIRSPRMSPTLASPAVMLVNIKISAPQQPVNTPIAFLPVMGSFKMSAANTMANIGMEVVTMLALMGEV